MPKIGSNSKLDLKLVAKFSFLLLGCALGAISMVELRARTRENTSRAKSPYQIHLTNTHHTYISEALVKLSSNSEAV